MDNTTEPEVLDLTTLSTTLPQQHDVEVRRDSPIRTLDTIFRANHSSIAITSGPASGKTTLMRQYVNEYPHDAVHLFLDPRSNYMGSYEIAVSELAAQLYFLWSGSVPHEEPLGPSSIRQMLPDIARHRRLKNRSITFVIDGLFDLDQKNPSLVNEILKLIPTRLNCARFLFSVSDANYGDCERYWPGVHPYSLPPLSRDETDRLLNVNVTEENDLVRLHRATDGHPGLVASISRLLQNGEPVDDILSSGQNELSSFYDMEWNRLTLCDEPDYLAIACLVFLPAAFDIDALSTMTGKSTENVRQLFARVPFVKSSNDQAAVPVIESHPFRSFLERRLSCYRVKALDAALDYVKSLEDDGSGVDLIPALLRSKGDNRALADYLTPQVIERNLNSSRSMLAVAEMTRQGVQATSEAQTSREQFYYALQSSVLLELLDNPAIPLQVEYYTTQADFTRALAFARSIFSVEGRLLGLSKVANEMSRQDRELDAERVEEIRGYIETVSERIPEERALDIAGQLIGCHQPLAAELLSTVAERSGEDNAFDWLITRLAQRTLEDSDVDAYEKVYESLGDDASTSLQTRLQVVRDLYTASKGPKQIVDQIRSLESIEQKNFLARAYLASGAKAHAKARLALAVLEEMIADGDYSPNASTYADLTRCLCEASPQDKTLERLAQLVRGQLNNLQSVGPTADYYQVRLNVAQYDVRALEKPAEDRLFDILTEAEGNNLEPDVHLICLTRLSNCIEDLAPYLATSNALAELVEYKVWQCVDTIVSHLADQDAAVLPAAYAKFERRSHDLFEIVSRLNTQQRRDALLRSCVERHAQHLDLLDASDEFPRFVRTCIERISDEDARSIAYTTLGRAVCNALRSYSATSGDVSSASGNPAVMGYIKLLLDLERNVQNPWESAVHAADILAACEQAGVALDDESVTRLAGRLEASLPITEELHGSKSILLDLAEYRSTKVSEFIARHEDSQTINNVFRANAIESVTRLISNLAVRSAATLLVGDEGGHEALLGELRELIEIVPSTVDQCLIWTHLAALLGNRRNDIATTVVQQHVVPKYYSVKEQDTDKAAVASSLLIQIAPILWVTQRSLLSSEIDAVSRNDKDRAYIGVLRYITKRVMPGEPDPPEGYWVSLKYNDLITALEIISEMVTDNYIWAALNDLLASDREHQILKALNAKQTDNLLVKLNQVLDEKLPSPEGVSHDGYKVLVDLASRARVKNEKLRFGQIESEVEPIGNISDCGFIYAELAGVLPKNQRDLRRRCLDAAIDKIERIPSAAERLGRGKVVIREASVDFPEVTRKKVDQWFRASLHNDSSKVLASQREIVDMAYRLDPDWGASLASVADEDKVSSKTQAMLKRAKKRREKEDLVSGGEWAETPRESINECVSVFWRALGVINAHGYSRLQNVDFGDILDGASRYELQSVFPVFAFYSNAEVARTPQDQRRSAALELIGAVKQAVRTLVVAVDGPIRERWNANRQVGDRGGEQHKYVPVGDRAQAFTFIRSWLQELDSDSVIVVDPYFTFDEIDVIRFAQEMNEEVDVTVIAGNTLLEKQKKGDSPQKEFRMAWGERYGGEEPPEVTLLIPYLAKESSSPIHDRWVISDTSVLNLGTSLSGFGGRDSTISVLGEAEGEDVRQRIEGYTSRRTKYKDGKLVKYIELPLNE